jgi:hypothetical protein
MSLNGADRKSKDQRATSAGEAIERRAQGAVVARRLCLDLHLEHELQTALWGGSG